MLSRQSFYLVFISLLLALSLASCNKCLQAYDKAAVNYDIGAKLTLLNSGSSLEDQAMGFTLMEEALPVPRSIDSAATFYQRALTEASQFTVCKTQLEQQNKYGNALTIQCLAAWQLRQYDQARNSREQALMAFEADPVDHTREEEIMASLPALINLQQFQDTLDMMTRFANGKARELVDAPEAVRRENYQNMKQTYQKFVLDDKPGSPSVKRSQKTLLQNIENVNSDNDSFRRLLAYALMRNMTQWTNANTQMDKIRRLLSITDQAEVDTIRSEEEAFRERRDEWKSLIENTLPEGADDAMYRQWKRNVGL